MAGGEGSRLRPITGNRPKPLVPICNEPVMVHILRHLKKLGIDEAIATVHYLANDIQNEFGDGSDLGISISYSIEDTPLGTAGSVKKAENQLRDGTFLIVSGDALTDCDFRKAIEFHKQKGAIATLILARVPNPLEYGVVITDADGKIDRFVEKPTWAEVVSDTVNTGMYILEPEIFDRMEEGQIYDWSKDIFPRLLREGAPVYGYVMEEYWADIGTIHHYRESQADLLSRKVLLEIRGNEISPGVFVDSNCQIDKTATLVPPVCLGRNCKVKAGARVGPYTAIGDHVLIEENAVIERSVIWDSVYIGPNVNVHSAICCARATLKKDAFVMEDAVIGDRCLLDVGSVIRPRVKLWPDKVIDRGSTVTMSLIWGNRWHGTLFRDLGVAGLSNIEITPEFAARLGAAFGSNLPPKSRVAISRDSTRSSRMIKRAVIAGLLGVGCDVLDLRGAAVPIARHAIHTSGATAGIHIRKLPTNSRVSLIEFFDSKGATIERNTERKIESTFSREDFIRTDPDDLGILEYVHRAVEAYESDAIRLISPKSAGKKRIVCDFGFSPVAPIAADLLGRFSVEIISLNAVNDAKLAPRTEADLQSHTDNIQQIVNRLEYDMGILFAEEGEKLVLIDDSGTTLSGLQMLGVMATLVCASHPKAKIAVPISVPDRLCAHLESLGAEIVRTRTDARGLMSGTAKNSCFFGGDDDGHFVFPEFHPGFDAVFAFLRSLSYLIKSGTKLSSLVAQLPDCPTAIDSIRCIAEQKGTVMRKVSELAPSSLLESEGEGLQVALPEGRLLIIPDTVEPIVHLYMQGDSQEQCEAGLAAFKAQLFAILQSASEEAKD